MNKQEFPRLKLALSDCLIGTECRYNGGHAQYDFVRYELAKYADFYKFCPEAAVIGTPRETIRLVNVEAEIRVIGPKSGQDYTDGLKKYTDSKVNFLQKQNLDGAVVKSRSPSCGLERIKVYRPTGEWYGSQDPMDMGVFTKAMQTAMPDIFIEEEGRLQDAWLRENFMLNLFTRARWRELMEAIGETPAIKQLQDFHRDHKYLLLSKEERLYREMGQVVAQTTKDNFFDQCQVYQASLFELLQARASKGKMVNVMQHMYGYFKNQVTESEKALFTETLQEFRQGIVPLISVVKLLQQLINHYGSEYLETQWILNPYPSELALRSKITAYR